ncbi:MAG: hypothetical protein AAB874_00660 [Patescibacteria group bacterium]
MAIGIYTYFRWLDDTLDEPSQLTQTQKLEILDRQRRLITGEIFQQRTNMEIFYMSLPWSAVRDPHSQLTMQMIGIIDSFVNDVRHQGCLPRTKKEIADHYIKTLFHSFSTMNIVLNGNVPQQSEGLMTFLKAWSEIASLKDLEKDLQVYMLQVGFEKNEAEQITEIPTPAERRVEAIRIYDRQRFYAEKYKALAELINSSMSLKDLNFPFWQTALSLLYMQRAYLKTWFTVRYPKNEILSKMKREGLKVKVKRLIQQDKKSYI